MLDLVAKAIQASTGPAASVTATITLIALAQPCSSLAKRLRGDIKPVLVKPYDTLPSECEYGFDNGFA